jgi:ATP-dependent Lhr-like helicase
MKVLEERGRTRRGYFVAGLGAAQFALPGAVDRLRSARDAVDIEISPDQAPPPIVLASTDPAQPFGATLGWPETAGRPARTATSLVVIRQGEALAWFDRRGHRLVLFAAGADDTSWASALAGLVRTGRERSVEVRKVDSGEITDEVAEALRSVGFADGYRGLVLRS